MKNKPILCLFANCLIVDGYCRSTICDLQRNIFHLIPLSLSNLFIEKRYINLTKIHENIKIEHHEILIEYIDFLLENELVFEVDEIDDLDNFQSLNLKWEFPAAISNAIIDVSADYTHDYCMEFIQLEDVGC